MASKKELPKWGPCIECGQKKVVESTALAGMVKCPDCGKLQVGQEIRLTKEGLPQTEPVPNGFSPVIPDQAGVSLGWRAWKIEFDPAGEPRLQSIIHNECHWPARTEVRAMCQGGVTCSRNGKQIPEPKCGCGLYSAMTREHLHTMSYKTYDPDTGEHAVIGQVKLWGTVITGTLGWRAEFGYPSKLYVPHSSWKHAKKLGEAYGVPFELNNIVSR